ncbi:Receptor-like protein kinase FERONIA [Acorus gramineus]|uniref:Receptor-like protein kinase FERONIA n=1 Tax=Acorus gramineus TaxID=55184 RepID=A0AAV9B2H4_ACOGR|nr:Receptor-like protein kinase FERONIA [Acorus gramineus]
MGKNIIPVRKADTFFLRGFSSYSKNDDQQEKPYLALASPSGNHNSLHQPDFRPKRDSLRAGREDLPQLQRVEGSDPNGLIWEDEIGSAYAPDIQNTVSTTPSIQDPSISTVPYMTARVFVTPYTYSFLVTPGLKFVRLHFYPSNFTNTIFVASDSFFSVSVGSHTLLNNFSAFLTTQAMSYDYISKEFSINISLNKLNLTFTPSKAFAFVNGVEIVSTPQIFGGSDAFNRPQIVGTMSTVKIDEHTETIVRLNVGGSAVSPKD